MTYYWRMRAMKSYDNIHFKNNIDTEEFVITILRDETLEGINEGIKEDLRTIYSYLKENQPVKHADIRQIINKSDKTTEEMKCEN
jgi:hypothetical protein